MTRWHTLLTLALVFTVALVLSQTTQLQADSISASDIGVNSAHSNHSPDGDGWAIKDTGGGNQDVYYDPNAGPWIKTLQFGGQGAGVGTIYTLTEFLHVGNGPDGKAPAWTDYHEEIRTPGWTWSPNGPNGEVLWGFTASDWVGNWTYVVRPGNTKVDWKFNPAIPFCNNLVLTKYLTYDGTGDPFAPIIIAQYPTVPEPGTLALLTMAGLGLGLFAWRRCRERR